MASQKKQDQVTDIVAVIKSNKNFALVAFGPTPHLSLEALRRELKTVGSGIKIIKNALFQKAINKLSQENKNYKALVKFFPLRENSALLTLKEDFVGGLSSFYKQSKSANGLTFKFGYLDEQIYQNEDLVKIAQLPPKEELLAKIIGSFKSPTTRFVHAIKFNVNKLVYVLKARSKQSN